MPTSQETFGHATKRLTAIERGQSPGIIIDPNLIAVAGFAVVGLMALACLVFFFPLLDITAAFSEFP